MKKRLIRWSLRGMRGFGVVYKLLYLGGNNG